MKILVAFCSCDFKKWQAQDCLSRLVGTYDIKVFVMDGNHVSDGIESALPVLYR